MRPLRNGLPAEEAARFRRIYCGLCHVLGERCGTAARFILNYDFTFLAIFLSEPEEDEPRRSRCPASPVRPQLYQPATSALELAADESVILAYWQIQDGISDHDWMHGLKYRAASGLLEPAYRRAAARRPEFDCAVRRQLSHLRTLEEAQCASMDRAADAFACLLAEAAGEIEDATRRRILEQIFYHLGRWIYLIDAADDLQEDAREGNYNPVALRFGLKDGQWTAESRQEFAQSLDHSVRMIATAFELWNFGVWRPILEHTIYKSLFWVGKAVLDGTFHRRKNQKKVEETSA